MKQKTSKYLAALIIVLGLIFIGLIPNCHGKDKIEDVFNTNNILLLIEGIQIDSGMMVGTITTVSSNSYIYAPGQSKTVGPFRKHCEHTIVPEGALIILKNATDESRYYINKGNLSYFNIDINTLRGMVKNGG